MVGLLAALIAVSAFLLFRDVRTFRAGGQLRTERRLRTILTGSATSTPDVEAVADWMTFDYLDRVFRLPPDYLKGALSITDARYPRMSIRRYARDAKLPFADAVTRVKDALRARPATY